MARKKAKGTELSVFKGREAMLNRAIFQTLALKGPRTIYELHKIVQTNRRFRNTKYASVNKRIKTLERLGYIKRVGIRTTKVGFSSVMYGNATSAYIALWLDSKCLEDVMTQLNEASAETLLALLVSSSYSGNC